MESASFSRAVAGFTTAAGVAGILLGAILGSPLAGRPAPTPASITVKEIGAQLMGPHAAALLIVGVILTVALLGAIIIAAVDKPEDPAP